jgi:Holliday junction resolvase RusA-like endonuclease
MHDTQGWGNGDMIVIYGKPLGKPRMTKRDRWAKRKCVTRYWAWCDLARLAAFSNPSKKDTLDAPTVVQVVAHFSHKTRRGPHLLRPDGDNILKSVCDALFENDEMIYRKTVAKFWTTGHDRVEVLITKEVPMAKEEAR